MNVYQIICLFFCVSRDKYHDDKFSQTKQKLQKIVEFSILKHLFLF